ncbi:translation initiation factor IF-2 associated domain-containing protein, partial [Neoroseomonas soli]
MSDQNEQDAGKSRLSLRPGGRLELGKTVDAGSVRQSFSHGRTKTVQVEVVKKRVVTPPAKPGVSAPARPAPAAGPAGGQSRTPGQTQPAGVRAPAAGRPLTQAEIALRQRVLEENRRVEAQRQREERERQALMVRSAAEEAARKAEEERRAAEEAAQRAEEEARAAAEAGARANVEAEARKATETAPATTAGAATRPAGAP